MYHPDENWQGLEVAYDLLYGGKSRAWIGDNTPSVETLLSWEWMSVYALRNHLYPFWLAIPGFILRLLNLDYNFIVVNSMYFMHMLVWSYGDYFFYHLTTMLCGKQCAIFCQMLSLTNEMIIRYVSHTSMNGVEGNLTIAALYYYF